MAKKSPERKIYDVLMRAVDSGTVPDGPETCRWASPGEMRRFRLVRVVRSCIWTQTAKSTATLPKLKLSSCCLSARLSTSHSAKCL